MRFKDGPVFYCRFSLEGANIEQYGNYAKYGSFLRQFERQQNTSF